jgi:hypothetical protein
MKKIALFLTVLTGLVVIVGCNNSHKTVTRFTPDGDTSSDTAKSPETIIKVKDTSAPAEKPAPIELKTDSDTNKDEAKSVEPSAPVPFEVTSLDKNLSQKNRAYQLIEGTTPEGTAKIVVNGTALGKYKAGETKWSYIAAVSLGNLQKGDNPFTVQALDADGNELGSKTFTLAYVGHDKGKLASTGPDSLTLAGLITLVVMGLLTFRRRNA